MKISSRSHKGFITRGARNGETGNGNGSGNEETGQKRVKSRVA